MSDLNLISYDEWATTTRRAYVEQIRRPQIPADATPDRRQALLEVSVLDHDAILELTPEDQAFVEAFIRVNRQLIQLAREGNGPKEAPVINLDHEMVYYPMGRFDPVRFGHVIAVGEDGTMGVLFNTYEAPEKRHTFIPGLTLTEIDSYHYLMPMTIDYLRMKNINPDL